MYLIDSDVLIAMGRGNTCLQEKMNSVGLTECALSEISLAELYVGAYKTGNQKLEPLLEFFEGTLKIIPITQALKTFAKLRVQLESTGARLETMDLFIAATALEGGHTLVSHNKRHYSRIPGLKMEDWLE